MKYLKLLVVIFVALAATACSDKKTSADGQDNLADYSEFMGEKAVASAANIDSLALEADFLEPRQGAEVLIGLSEIARHEEGAKSGKRLEYMRKFVDTYDILSGRGEDFRQAIADATESAHVNLRQIYLKYVDALGVEAGGDVIESEEAGEASVASPKAETSDESAAEPAAAVPDSVQA